MGCGNSQQNKQIEQQTTSNDKKETKNQTNKNTTNKTNSEELPIKKSTPAAPPPPPLTQKEETARETRQAAEKETPVIEKVVHKEKQEKPKTPPEEPKVRDAPEEVTSIKEVVDMTPEEKSSDKIVEQEIPEETKVRESPPATEMSGPVSEDEINEMTKRLKLDDAVVFDSEFAMEQVGDDWEFLVELKDTLVELYNEVTTTCATAIPKEDWSTVFEQAHSIKGAVANLGLNRIRDVSLALEQSGRAFSKKASGEEVEITYSKRDTEILLRMIHISWEQFNEVFDVEIKKLENAS